MASTDKHSILIVEDDPMFSRMYQEYLGNENYDVDCVETARDALQNLGGETPDLVILDLKLPDGSGFSILEHIADQHLPTSVIVVTGEGSMRTAIDAMKLGARDFLVKPFDQARFNVTIKNALETQELRQVVSVYREKIDRKNFQGFIGSSLEMQAVYRTIESSANSRANVFITGESGTGKEVCAEAIHHYSSRRSKPFTAVNCGAIPKDLIESEIFGHVKGAFTGAVKDRKGSVGQAEGGTLFLDEICEMDLSLQPKLLRFLQTGTYQRVGSEKLEKANVRILCATNRDPWQEVMAGRFREDLYYRLHVLPITLPPLRDRQGDALEIAKHFLSKYAAEEGKAFNEFDPEVEAVIERFPWPGNVRQLQNVVRNIIVLNDGETVLPEMLPSPLDYALEDMRNGVPMTVQMRPTATFSAPMAMAPAVAPPAPVAEPAPTPSYIEPPVRHAEEFAIASEPLPATPQSFGFQSQADISTLADIERQAIEAAIEVCGGNIPEAAVRLGISAATIYRKRNTWDENDSAAQATA